MCSNHFEVNEGEEGAVGIVFDMENIIWLFWVGGSLPYVRSMRPTHAVPVLNSTEIIGRSTS